MRTICFALPNNEALTSEYFGRLISQFADSIVTVDPHLHSDRSVEISIPYTDKFQDHAPVLLDDIISTAKTMIETIHHLKQAGMKPLVCIGVHVVFADNTYEDLLKAGVAQLVTCNTIHHESNKIDLTALLSSSVENVFKQERR